MGRIRLNSVTSIAMTGLVRICYQDARYTRVRGGDNSSPAKVHKTTPLCLGAQCLGQKVAGHVVNHFFGGGESISHSLPIIIIILNR